MRLRAEVNVRERAVARGPGARAVGMGGGGEGVGEGGMVGWGWMDWRGGDVSGIGS